MADTNTSLDTLNQLKTTLTNQLAAVQVALDLLNNIAAPQLTQLASEAATVTAEQTQITADQSKIASDEAQITTLKGEVVVPPSTTP